MQLTFRCQSGSSCRSPYTGERYCRYRLLLYGTQCTAGVRGGCQGVLKFQLTGEDERDLIPHTGTV